MKGCFPTRVLCSSCLHVPNPPVALPRIVQDACSISRPLLSLLNALPVTPPPPLLNGAAHAGTYGTTAHSIVHLASPQARASDLRVQGCAKRLLSHLGTPRTPGSMAPCGLILLLLTCRPLGTAPLSQGLLPPFLLRRHLAMAASRMVTPPRQRKALKTFHHVGKIPGTKPRKCKNPPVETQQDAILIHDPPSCPPFVP